MNRKFVEPFALFTSIYLEKILVEIICLVGKQKERKKLLRPLKQETVYRNYLFMIYMYVIYILHYETLNNVACIHHGTLKCKNKLF